MTLAAARRVTDEDLARRLLATLTWCRREALVASLVAALRVAGTWPESLRGCRYA